MRSDHPTKLVGICICFKNLLPSSILNIHILQGSINSELIIDNKLCNLLMLYRPPSQSCDRFESFLKNFESILERVTENNHFLIAEIKLTNSK